MCGISYRLRLEEAQTLCQRDATDLGIGLGGKLPGQTGRTMTSPNGIKNQQWSYLCQ